MDASEGYSQPRSPYRSIYCVLSISLYTILLWDTVALVQTVICSIFHLPLQSPIRLHWKHEWPKWARTRRSQVQHGALGLRLRDCMKRRGSRQLLPRQSRCHAARGLISYCECAMGGLCCRWALTVQYSGAGCRVHLGVAPPLVHRVVDHVALPFRPGKDV